MLIVLYFPRFTSVKLSYKYLRPRLSYLGNIVSLGMASMINQISFTIVNIVMNNTLKYYGALSRFGTDIPIACVGIAGKLNFLMIAFAVGIAQGCQPIHGYNYGARNYDRVRETYMRAAVAITCINLLFFACFQLIPRQIISLFGTGSALYFEFGVRYLRVYMMMTCVNGIQPVTGNFFSSIGKAKTGAVISLTRQFLFLLPLLLLLPRLWGIDGVMYAGPIADFVAFVLAVLFMRREFTRLHRLQAQENARRAQSDLQQRVEL